MTDNAPKLSPESVPRHVAVIMDGNGRWAHQRGSPRAMGHRAGVKSVRKVLRAAHKSGVRVLTLYAFSQENWSRPPEEVRLLMQLFIVFFALPLIGIETSAWTSAAVGLTLFTAAYLAEIWRGCVEAVPKGQWEASASLAMTFPEQMRHVILPQALRIAVPPTVGFSVQVVKGTAVTSIIGFVEVTKAGTMITNATFQPFLVYGLVGLIYFALCYPLSLSAKALERELNVAR